MPKRLLPLERFAPIFEPFRGKLVTLTEGVGWNPGDLILYRATEQLCKEFGVAYEKDSMRGDHCFLFAGGNVQSPYAKEIQIRNDYISEAYKRGIPMTLLPQSFFPPITQKTKCQRNYRREILHACERVFVREKASLKYAPENTQLAPDIALGFSFPDLPEIPTTPDAHILRRDLEGMVARNWNLQVGDPIKTKNVNSLYTAARSGLHIYTDRLHVAITALAYGRQVTLIGNSYHKNRSMWETWLKDLGCQYLTPSEYCSLFSRREVV